MIERGSVRYDEQADILYIHRREGFAVSEEFIPGVSIDIDEESGEVLGIEICEASRILAPLLEGVKKIQTKTVAS
ncbi:MAG: DUF2283 domain-containing protein [Candidatus Bipolaricaulota bacterium]|nr:DUF2283 domain-containing protein [Candidatus Bipolaricaulota bacterium]MCS7274936.1 DUF2283 domain-containing protein [Candidatus Bipolaricaulota bacterium]MDW8110551.1 DUF2283 domain-containing protein [Candidatus Bipolaricaulota bacterium]MDW8329815.1 DUF2283 domain-containing protein [Candidatus Bipolaricaulota bacterium]